LGIKATGATQVYRQSCVGAAAAGKCFGENNPPVVQVGSGSHRFARVKHHGEPLGGYLHLRPWCDSSSLNELIRKSETRLNPRLPVVLFAPVYKRHERRLEFAFNIGLKYFVPKYPGECLPFVLK
jgi:hypothetical protein